MGGEFLSHRPEEVVPEGGSEDIAKRQSLQSNSFINSETAKQPLASPDNADSANLGNLASQENEPRLLKETSRRALSQKIATYLREFFSEIFSYREMFAINPRKQEMRTYREKMIIYDRIRKEIDMWRNEQLKITKARLKDSFQELNQAKIEHLEQVLMHPALLFDSKTLNEILGLEFNKRAKNRWDKYLKQAKEEINKLAKQCNEALDGELLGSKESEDEQAGLTRRLEISVNAREILDSLDSLGFAQIVEKILHNEASEAEQLAIRKIMDAYQPEISMDGCHNGLTGGIAIYKFGARSFQKYSATFQHEITHYGFSSIQAKLGIEGSLIKTALGAEDSQTGESAQGNQEKKHLSDIILSFNEAWAFGTDVFFTGKTHAPDYSRYPPYLEPILPLMQKLAREKENILEYDRALFEVASSLLPKAEKLLNGQKQINIEEVKKWGKALVEAIKAQLAK